MAITKIHAIKATINKAVDYIIDPKKTEISGVDTALDYIENPDKTNKYELVTGYNVDPKTAAIEFKVTAKTAQTYKGNYSKAGGANNLAYHLIQSFSPEDNVTPEQAHQIGKELADEFLQGKYEYVLSTHIDKGHIHNHIIINAVSFYDFKKLRTEPYKTAAKIRSISDRLCSEHDLSVIHEKGNLAYSYDEYKARKQNNSWKSEIRKRLKYVLETATDYEEYKACAQALGVTVDDTGKHIKYKLEGQERFSRGNKLADTDTFLPSGIRERVEQNKANQAYLKDAIKKVAQQVNHYDLFVKELEKNFNISIKQKRSGTYVFQFNDIKIEDHALGLSFCIPEIQRAIADKDYRFIEHDKAENIQSYYDAIKRPTKKQNEIAIKLSDKNILKVTPDGILIRVPNEQGKTQKIFISNREINYDEAANEYTMYVSSHFDYYFVKDALDPDTLESKQLSDQYIKGEQLIRDIEIDNQVKPRSIKISLSDIKSLSEKGVILTIPELGIESLFIGKEYVTVDKEDNSCTVDIYENWSYQYRADKQEGSTYVKQEKILGASLIDRLHGRSFEQDQSLRYKIANYSKRVGLADTKALTETLMLMRQENVYISKDFDIRIAELQDQKQDIKEKIRGLENKTEQYKNVVKWLNTYQSYLPIKQELENKTIFTKSKYEAKHESELTAFKFATEKLDQVGVNYNVDPEKVKNLILDHENKLQELNRSFKDMEHRIVDLRRTQEQVKPIIKDREKKSREEQER